jgi:hypothetical protein
MTEYAPARRATKGGFMKPGHKTTELYLAIAGILTTVLNDKLGLNLDSVAVASIMGTVIAYIAGRSALKKY